jgi:sigma-B regulation protein RsbU (phosphoserine phosphatase)
VGAIWQHAEASAPRVLVAEDQPHVRDALRLLLKSAGFQITDVATPAALLAELSARPYDALLLDLNYTRDTTSGAEGLELLPSIRQLDRTLPVVVMTAWGTVDVAVEALHRGADDFIQKPWDNTRLVSLLRAQMENSRQLRRKQAQKEFESEELREIQAGLLPKEIPQVDGCRIAVEWHPAGDVGGDYFDVLPYGPGRVGLCIADVAGKGVPAALLMSNLQAAARAHASETIAPKDFCARLNGVACANTSRGRFTTFFYARLDTVQQRVTYCNAGHNAPLLVRADGSCERLDEGGPVFGEFPETEYAEGEVPLRSGDRLVLFTDGVTEAYNANGAEFGERRLIELVRQLRHMDSAAMEARILAAVRAHTGGQLQDDATLMIVAAE